MTDVEEIALLKRQLARERLARQTAEDVGERATRELHDLVVSLRRADEERDASRGSVDEIAREPWFRTTLSSLGDAVIATDVEGRVRFVNPAAASLTGWRAEEAEGRPLDDVFRIVQEGTKERLESPVARVLREGTVVGLGNHSLLLGRGGQEYAIEDSGAPITHGGRTDGVVLVFRDVTPARRELRRRQLLFEATEVLSATLDLRDALGRLCAAAVAWYCDWCAVYVRSGNAIELQAVGHADEEERERLRAERPSLALATRVIASGRPELVAGGDPEARTQVCVPIRHGPDVVGAIALASVGGRVYTTDDVEVASELASRADVALHRAQLYAEALEANRIRDEFLAAVSHELRNQLSSILGWLQIVKRDPGNVELVRHGAEVAERNARAEARLVGNLLDFHRVLTGRVKLEPVRLDLTELARAEVDSVRSVAEANGIVLAFAGARTCPVDGDPDRMRQVLSNLIGNALKFTPAGGRVEVSTRCDGERVRLVVHDTGVGIDPALLPRVFEAFRQSDPSTGRKTGSLGIGLAIARQFAELHGGRLVANSPGLGQGSTFELHLPAAVGEGEVAAERGPRLRGVRVLVVEDDTDLRTMAVLVLGDAGAVVDTTESVEEAIRHLDDRRFDAVVTDVGLPGRGSYELLERVRSRSAVPVIALTAYAAEGDEERQRGFARYVEKPVDPEDLVAAVGSVVSPRTPAPSPLSPR